MAYTLITQLNALDYPKGTRVRLNAGAMFGTVDATVTGFRTTTQFGTVLTATTDDGIETTISGFTDIGIGAYLLSVAAAPGDKTSPWYRAA